MCRAVAAWLGLAAIVAAAASVAAADPAPLPALHIERGSVTASGVSSGGFFAQQLQIAFSATIGGVGVVAAGPFFCAGNNFGWNVPRALNVCADFEDFVPFFGPPRLDDSVAAARRFSTEGKIDDLGNLKRAHVYLFSGKNDTKVPSSVVEVADAFYRTFVSDATAQIRAEFAVPAAHAWVTADFGNACTVFESPFLNDCDFDTAQAVLGHLYGALAPRTEPSGMLLRFDQRPFFGGDRAASLADAGYVYIPARCGAGTPCRLHIALHGCQQSATQIGETFVRQAGFNEWADANDIVVLYPQTAALDTRWFGVTLPWPNPQACWDWWGFTGPAFAVKTGRQPAAVKAMIDRLGGT